MEKVLLLMLPYWTPVIPPAGLSCLKAYLSRYGYPVKTVDANVEIKLREMYDQYFTLLKTFIPLHKQGVFNNIGNPVWQHHMMAHQNYEDESEYFQLVKIVVYQTFFHWLDDSQIRRLNGILTENYTRLEEYILGLLEKEKPEVLGISVFSGTLPSSWFTFKLVKKHYPHIMTVMGGGIFYDHLAVGSPNLDFFLEKTKGFIDKLIIGEGEILFRKLLQGEFPRSRRVFTQADTGGEILDLAGVDIPDPSDLEIQHYPYLNSYASRSCPYQCTFCSDPILWGRYRKKSPEQIVYELTTLYKRYGSQLFILSDLLLNPIATELSEEFTRSAASIYWDTHFRISEEACDPEKTFLWRRGGMYRVEMGVESGSQRILDLMGKKITLKQTGDALNALALAGVKTTTYWVIGYPGETEEDFRMTLDLLEELKDVIYEAELNPFWYVPTGQVNSGEWAKISTPLYPENAADMLIVREWILDCEPSREERFKRVNRFVQHCKKLGIPDPYSVNEIYRADERWKKLQKNAVPSIIEFKDKNIYIDENKRIKKVSTLKTKLKHDGNWGF
jgi:hypothetical protein